ncbi:MAG TPA: DUF3810 domain-containing protein, partial [Phnomibacter sp.]|nr:DUF3810 domain-containing protein [Phnomibacter sp.]
FNYYRLGSRQLFGIQPRPYTTAQVDTLVQVAINNLNSLCTDTTKLEQSFTTRPKALATQAQASYNRASHQWPFLQFRRSSLKPHLIGRLQSYTGYAGYINPFTQEAQVNFYMPRFELPFTVCHEMAHQLGFGSESEANWIGFMACRSSASIAFAYSGYYQTTLYALSQLFTMDSTLAAQRKEQLPPVFLKHYAEMKAFGQAHQNPAQTFLNRLYDGYLRTQNQPEGVATYNQMVAWQIAYAQVYGWESLNWVGPAKTGLAE